MMTKLILVRHGESEANNKDIFVGYTDSDLTTKRFKQAEKTAVYIKHNYNVDAVYASDLKRAYKTGNVIAETLDVEINVEKGLRENIWRCMGRNAL